MHSLSVRLRLLAPLLVLPLTMGSPAFGAQLGSVAQSVFPSTSRQIISLNYHRLASDPTAQQVEDQVLPPEMKNLTSILQLGGVDPAANLNRLTFATYGGKDGVGMLGLAEGDFSGLQLTKFFTKTAKQPTPVQFQGVDIYTSQGLVFFVPDSTSLVFGSRSAIETAITTEQGGLSRIGDNPQMQDLISGTETTDVWSVLDATGARTMVHQMVGTSLAGLDSSSLDRFLNGSRYTIQFKDNIQVNLEVITNDTVSAATLSTGLGMAIQLRQHQEQSPVVKALLNQIQVDSAGEHIFLQLVAPETTLATLIHTDVFQSIVH